MSSAPDAGERAVREGLAAFLAQVEGGPVGLADLARVSSVGNAREPWSFTAVWPDGRQERCVLLVKAAAGQLETELAPEYLTIAALAGTGVAVPPAFWLDPTGDWVGGSFFVTGWVAGSADTRSLRRDADPEVAAVARQLAAQAARLHAVPPEAVPHLEPVTAAEAGARQLGYWHDVFLRHRSEPHPDLVYLFAWLRRRMPPARRVGVVHGDLRFGNLLADGGRLTALLDWEMVHLGDPVEDLGWVYRTLWSPARSLPFEEFLRAYVEAGGDEVPREHLRWYQVFGEVKHAMISLTAARSFADRATSSLRHADRAATLPAMVARALQLVEAAGREEGPC